MGQLGLPRGKIPSALISPMAPETGLILRKPRAHPRTLALMTFPDPLPDPAPARAADAPEASEASASRPRGGIAPGRCRAAAWHDRRDQHAVAGRQHAVLVPAAVSPGPAEAAAAFRGGPTAHRSAAQRHRHGLGQLPQLLVRAHPARALGRRAIPACYADWYLVNCNHQSWVDIFVLQATLNRRIPLLKFFSSSSSSTCR